MWFANQWKLHSKLRQKCAWEIANWIKASFHFFRVPDNGLIWFPLHLILRLEEMVTLTVLFKPLLFQSAVTLRLNQFPSPTAECQTLPQLSFLQLVKPKVTLQLTFFSICFAAKRIFWPNIHWPSPSSGIRTLPITFLTPNIASLNSIFGQSLLLSPLFLTEPSPSLYKKNIKHPNYKNINFCVDTSRMVFTTMVFKHSTDPTSHVNLLRTTTNPFFFCWIHWITIS